MARIEAKHFRWISELLQGGSRLLHRPGVGALHRAPDAISRHPEGRDALILARAQEWTDQRERIRNIQKEIESGKFDDDEPELVSLDRVPPEELKPLPSEVMKAAGLLDEPVYYAKGGGNHTVAVGRPPILGAKGGRDSSGPYCSSRAFADKAISRAKQAIP